jgi:hypothetical protein
MGKRISRCVELLEQDQTIYCDGQHNSHVLTHAQDRIDAGALGRITCRRRNDY